MDRKLRRRRRTGTAFVFVVMTMLAYSGFARAQSVDARRLDELRMAVQTEMRHIEAESFDGQAPLLAELEELRDLVGYLRVASRRGEAIDERELLQVEGRLEGLRAAVNYADARAHDRGLTAPAPEIPAGAELTLRLPNRLDAPTAQTETAFEAATLADVAHRAGVIVPAGSVIRGAIRRVEREARTDGRAGLIVALREVTVQGRTYAVQLRVTHAVASDGRPLTIRIGRR